MQELAKMPTLESEKKIAESIVSSIIEENNLREKLMVKPGFEGQHPTITKAINHAKTLLESGKNTEEVKQIIIKNHFTNLIEIEDTESEQKHDGIDWASDSVETIIEKIIAEEYGEISEAIDPNIFNELITVIDNENEPSDKRVEFIKNKVIERYKNSIKSKAA